MPDAPLPPPPLVATKEEGNFNYKSSHLIRAFMKIYQGRAHNLPCNYFIMAWIILTRVNNNLPRTATKAAHLMNEFF
jgi:hypothetical protein